MSTSERKIEVFQDTQDWIEKDQKKHLAVSRIQLLNASCADQTVDAVVNAANSGLWAGGGICGVIFSKAGYELETACKKHKTPLSDGDAVITPAFNMKNAKAIIHAVGENVIIGLSPSDFRKRGSHGGLVHICLRRQ